MSKIKTAQKPAPASGTDNIYLTGRLEARIRDAERAAAIMHSMIYDGADDEQVRWVADKILDDSVALVSEFEAALEAKHKSFAAT